MKFLLTVLVSGMFALCIFGAITTVMQSRDVLTGIASLSWPETSGTITKWKVEPDYGGPTASSASRVFLTCEYRYIVGDTEYTNSRVASYPLSNSDINRIGYSVSEGSVQKVYYDPTNPKIAVLVRGWKCWMLLIGCAFFIGPLAIILALWKSRGNILGLWKDWAWFSLPK
jgi:hypothetical protein